MLPTRGRFVGLVRLTGLGRRCPLTIERLYVPLSGKAGRPGRGGGLAAALLVSRACPQVAKCPDDVALH